MFGSRNSMSLDGHCVWPVQFVSGRWGGHFRSCFVPLVAPPNRNSIPLDMLSRIPTASLGEPSGEGTAPLVCRILKHTA
jgi:hypothetical protein